MAKGQSLPGELLQQLRIRAGYASVRAAAKAMQMSHTRLGELEEAPGELGMRTETAQKLARTYSTPVGVILRIASGALDELPDDLGMEGVQTRDLARASGERGGRIHPVRFLGTVSAGLTGDGVAMPIDWLSVSDYFIGGYKPEDLYALEVTGESMISAKARERVPPGSIILVHEKLKPEPGHLIVVWLEQQDIGVLKEYQQDEEGAWLLSRNPAYAPIYVDEANPGYLRGVMIGHWTKGPGPGIR